MFPRGRGTFGAAQGQDQGGAGRPINFSFQRGTSNALEASGSGTSSSGGAAVGGNAAFPIPQTGGSGFPVQGFQPMIGFQANSMLANNAGFGINMGPRGVIGTQGASLRSDQRDQSSFPPVGQVTLIRLQRIHNF
jgi:hypothetical protein